jgi:hypothetical protein
MTQPAFHFLMLAAGEILQKKSKNSEDGTVSAEEIQKLIYDDDTFAVKVPIEDCLLALKLLTDVGFLERFNHDSWSKPATW